MIRVVVVMAQSPRESYVLASMAGFLVGGKMVL